MKNYYKSFTALFRQAVKFGLVGVINTGLDYVIFTILVRYMDRTVANIISYSCGIVSSYLLNRLWTFKAKGAHTPWQMTTFLLVNLLALAISTTLLNVGVHTFGLSDNMAKLFAIPFAMGVNFLGNRFIVYRNR